MTVQNNINIARRNFRRNMDQPEFQTFAGEINNQRPVLIPITISTNNSQRRSDSFEIESDRGFANVAQMPDLIRAGRKIANRLGQFVMGIGQDEDLHSTESRTTDATGTEIAISQFRRDLCALCARS